MIDVDTIRSCIDELLGRDNLLQRVAQLLPTEQAPGRSEAGKGRGAKKQPAAPTPWNDEAAGVLFVIHAAAREVEADLTRLLFSRRLARSGSDVHTRRALRNIPDLLAVASERFPDALVVREAPRQVVSWPRSCRLILDEARWGEERWTAAPGGLLCPHCGRRLVLKPGWEREVEPPVWCLRCPVKIDDQEPDAPTRSWPADAWIATLNSVAGSRS